ncbi:DUF2723 domain-containing protein [Bacteroidota bacterium]
MNTFRRANIITGWIVFLISAIVYLITKEPTASFWDCGEFIASSYKLEVGHPPGAPFFMLISNFFSLFASGPEQVAKWINTVSAIASAMTIAFLYWTITHLAKKIISKSGELDLAGIVSVIGAGLVGALAYTFSDTFWFSAAEAEVYATSSLFTALVFWAILKWENVADSPRANRWIILIAYLMGLSIGVHLLNLLAIPAIVFVYYFRKYETTRKGVLTSFVVSVLLLGVLLYLIIPGIIKVASIFELIAVNGIGLPYNSGVVLFIIVTVGVLSYLIMYSHRTKKVLLNTILVSFTVITIGYFSYGLILVRSIANTPMEQNDPETVFSLLDYVNREQYGSSPLIRGEYYNAPILGAEEGKPVRTKVDGKYQITSYRQKLNYDERFLTIFPRMWSSQANHIREYEKWGKIEGSPITVNRPNGESEVIRKPGFSENLRFFFRYQVGHMYLRYFMWNFAGRQNDLQGHGEVHKGNWLSGLNFIDEARLGQQENLPSFLKDNPARNRYFMLPLLLGLGGLLFHYQRKRKDFWVVVLLFFMTGLAIVVYLNQYPLQPRERDYAYSGSFYAFAIWIGLGVLGLSEWIRKKLPGILAPGIVTLICLILVPGVLLRENWDDHDRSGRYTARDFSYNYLNSCAPNAILFTNGDNDTFPLWYIQEVEGVRTDVRVVNLSYLGADWYIQQVSRKAYESDGVPFAMTKDQYITGKRDFVYLVNRIDDYVDLGEAMAFLRSEDPRTKTLGTNRDRIDYIPASKFKIPIDSAHMIETGTVRPELADLIVPEIQWTLPSSSIRKNAVMVMDFLDNNNWKRPVYYSVTVARDLYLNLQEYFQIQGLTYRLVPIKHTPVQGQIGSIDIEILFDNMVNKFKWGGVTDTTVYLDENNKNMLTNFRNNFGRLANECLAQGDTIKAKAALDRCMEVIPPTAAPFDYFVIPVIEGYYRLGETELANSYLTTLSAVTEEELRYFFSLDRKHDVELDYDKQLRLHTIQETLRLASQYGQEEIFEKQEQTFQELVLLYQSNT